MEVQQRDTHLEKIHKKSLKQKHPDPEPTKTNVSVAVNTESFAETNDDQPRKKQKITNYFAAKNEKSLEAIVSRTTAKDGLPFSIFCTSEDLRRLLSSSGFKVPTSSNTIRNMVVTYSKKIKAQVKGEIHAKKSNGHKFSITFDEWTSAQNKRFLNLNLHYTSVISENNEPPFWSLGLVRIVGEFKNTIL